VNAVKFLPNSQGTILSGSVDKTVRIWKKNPSSGTYACSQTLSDHTSSINCIAVAAGARFFATGSADSSK
jgi:elongator complex protein 2